MQSLHFSLYKLLETNDPLVIYNCMLQTGYILTTYGNTLSFICL